VFYYKIYAMFENGILFLEYRYFWVSSSCRKNRF
jgi:hypothetical protein